MEVKQVYEIVNDGTKELIGDGDIIQTDLSNIADVGRAVENVNGETDSYNRILNKIGKTEVIDRKLDLDIPEIVRDGWEWGSIVERIRCDIPDAIPAEMWRLRTGAQYPQDVYYGNICRTKYWNQAETYQINDSTEKKQYMQSFESPAKMNAFLSAKKNAVRNGITKNNNILAHLLLCELIAETVYADYGSAAVGDATHLKAVNLLYEYNEKHSGNELTVANCLESKDFLTYAGMRIKMYRDFIKTPSKAFNCGGLTTWTPANKQHLLTLTHFDAALTNYLLADTFHNEMKDLPVHTTIPYLQATGDAADDETMSFETCSAIDVTTASGHDVEMSGILAVLYDADAMAIYNEEISTEVEYNKAARFYTDFNNVTTRQNVDLDLNAVVFFIADPTPTP